jgi:phosphopantothenoylcysteine decarboxylase/phosphopantothenate--cysteine ligase
MNSRMWEHPATLGNVELLTQRGALWAGPELGRLACGDWGPGRLAAPSLIAEKAWQLAIKKVPAAGKKKAR